MPTLRFPLVGSITSRLPDAHVSTITDTKDQKFTNCFPEVTKNELTGKQEVTLAKRQGYIASSDVQASATGSYGAVVWTANSAATAPAIFSFLKSTSTDMMFFDTAGTQIGGDVATTDTCLSMEETDISGTGNLTAILTDSGSGAKEAWFFPEGGAWTQITDSDFPSDIMPAHAHIDGYMVVMASNGRLYNSDPNSLSAWTAANYITAQSFADNGVGCARYKELIVGFGDMSMEFFRNAGNSTGSPFSRLQNATLRIGAMRHGGDDSTAIRAIGDTVYWLGINADSGARGIYRLNGMQAEKVSSPTIDKMLSNGVIRSILGSFNLLGMSHIAFGSVGLPIPCYCVDLKFWWYFSPGSSGTPNPTAFLSVDSASFSKSYWAAETNAKIHTFNPNAPVWQDASSAYSLEVQTGNMTFNTRKKKFFGRLSIEADKQSSASAIGVSWSDDDYATFTTARNIDTSTNQTWIKALGASDKRAWKFTHSANTPCRIQAVEIDYELGQ